MSNTIINSRVLVLNKYWFPVGVLPLRNAFCKLFNERAKALNHNDYGLYDFKNWLGLNDNRLDYLRASSTMIPIPEILVSSFYDRVPKLIVNSSRKNILKRDKYVCQYSGIKLEPSEATVDHIIPKSKGGKHSWINCVASSFSINNKKSDSYLEETGLELIRKPFTPNNKILFNLSSNFYLPESWKEFLFKNYTKSRI